MASGILKKHIILVQVNFWTFVYYVSNSIKQLLTLLFCDILQLIFKVIGVVNISLNQSRKTKPKLVDKCFG